MAHVLTNSEALAVLRLTTADDCPDLELLQSAVDDGLLTETGRNWSVDATIDPTAKLAASILLVALHDGTPVPDTYRYKIVQLDGKAKAAVAEVTA